MNKVFKYNVRIRINGFITNAIKFLSLREMIITSPVFGLIQVISLICGRFLFSTRVNSTSVSCTFSVMQRTSFWKP